MVGSGDKAGDTAQQDHPAGCSTTRAVFSASGCRSGKNRLLFHLTSTERFAHNTLLCARVVRGPGDPTDQTPAPELSPPGARMCPANAKAGEGNEPSAGSFRGAAQGWGCSWQATPAQGGVVFDTGPRLIAGGHRKTRGPCPPRADAGGLVVGRDATRPRSGTTHTRTVRVVPFFT